MGKLTLKSVNNLSSTEMEAALTDNFTAIEDAVDDCVSRTGKLPNQMEADLDMNGNTIINAKDPVSDTDVATKSYVDNYTTDITWKGDWAPGTDYDENNVVSYNGSGYICINAHTSSSSDTPDSSSNWSLIVSKGDKGDAGELTLSGSVSVTADYTVTKAANASGVIEVNTTGGAVVLTVDDSVSDSWFFIYREVAGSNGVTVKKASDGSTVTTNSSGIIVCDGTTITSPVGVEDGSVTTPKLADAAVTPSKIDSAQDFEFGQITSSGNDPRLILREDDTITVARIMLAGGVTYIQPGAAGSGTTASSGDLAFCGLGYTNLNSFKVKTGGSWNNVWHDGNFAARIAALTANASPAGTESVACDDGQRISIDTIRKASFTSGAITLLSGDNSYTVAHGLGSVPSEVRAYIKCIVPEWGYNVGDILQLVTNIWWYSVNRGTYITADATNIYFANSGSTLTIVEKGTVTIQAVTVSNWELYLEAVK